MKMLKVKTFVPIFPGFYETAWSFDEEDMAYSLEDQKLDKDQIVDWLCMDGVNYSKYEEDVAKHFTDVVMKLYPFVKGWQYESLISPQYYNYQTDSIDVEIEIELTEFLKIFLPLLDKFDKWVSDHYTSYDGFMSYYPNNANGWIEKTNGFTELNGHYLGAIMQFMWDIGLVDELNGMEITEQDLYEWVFEEIYLLDYIDIDEFDKFRKETA